MTGKIRRVNVPRNLRGLGLLVRAARAARGLSVTDAARDAGVGRSTWEAVENGKAVRDYNLGKIERVLDWQPGSIMRWLRNSGPVPGGDTDDNAAVPDQTPREIIEGLAAAGVSGRTIRLLLQTYDLAEGDGDADRRE